MKKEYRRELKELRRTEVKLYGDLKKHVDACDRAVAKLTKSAQRSGKATDKELFRINRRRAILQGRLS